MTDFSMVLNDYIKKANISAKELSDVCGISIASLSRYKNGSRTPKAKSETIKTLSKGISKFYKKEAENDIYNKLNDTLPLSGNSFPDFSKTFDRLIKDLHINVNDLSNKLSVDPSYLSRIRNGSRLPASFESFISSLASYIFDTQNSEIQRAGISTYFKISTAYSKDNLTKALFTQFGTKDKSIGSFLLLDALSSFSESSIIDTSRIAKQKSLLHLSKQCENFYNNDFDKGELEFYKTTALSPTCDQVSIFSEIPFSQNNNSVAKKKLFGLCACMAKGAKVTYISNTKDTSLMEKEIAALLPLFFAGEIDVLFSSGENSLKKNIDMVSDACALFGEISGTNKRSHLSYEKEDVKYQKTKFENIEKIIDTANGAKSTKDLATNHKGFKTYKNLALYFSGKECLISKTDNPGLSIILTHPALAESIKTLFI